LLDEKAGAADSYGEDETRHAVGKSSDLNMPEVADDAASSEVGRYIILG